MALMRTSDFPQLLDPGLRKVFYLYLKDTPTEYETWVNVKQTERSFEDDHKISEFGAVPEKNEGDSVLYEDMVAGSTKRYTFPEFELGFLITRKMMDDDLYGVMVQATKALRRSFRNLYEVRSYRILNNATSATSPFNGLDGLALLSTAHTNLKGGTQSNRPATHVDISQTALEAAVIHFHGLKGEAGLPVFKTPSLAIVSSEDQFLAAKLLRNAMRYDTANHEENWIRQGPDDNGISRYLPSRYFTDSDQWFVVAEKDEHTAYLFERIAPEFETNVDFNTGNLQAKGYCRIESGYSDWRGWYGSTGG